MTASRLMNAPGPTPGLMVDTIRVRYGQHIAVDGVSFQVSRGEIVGLLGPNGSGKSTTLSAAAGVLEPYEGTISIDGIRRDQAPHAFALRIGLVPQEPALLEDLSAEANLRFFGKLYGLGGANLTARVEQGLQQARLIDRRRGRVADFSGGMKQRLNLAVALLHQPTVLLLDEPTAALDPASRDALFATLHELREQDHAILLTTHHLDEAEHGCDRIVVLDAGRVVAAGRPAELIRYQPGNQAILYAHLPAALPKFFQRSLKRRVGEDVELEFIGRRLRVSAPSQIRLGQALAVILGDGIALETFRTPPGRLEAMLRRTPALPTDVSQPAPRITRA